MGGVQLFLSSSHENKSILTPQGICQLIKSGLWVVPEQGVHGHHNPGSAESTLGAVTLGNPLLEAKVRNADLALFSKPTKSGRRPQGILELTAFGEEAPEAHISCAFPWASLTIESHKLLGLTSDGGSEALHGQGVYDFRPSSMPDQLTVRSG